LKRQGIRNVNLQTGNAARDWGNRLFDAIAITGSMPFLPDSWKQRLALHGRLFVIIGEAPIMEAMLITRIGEQQWLSESLFDTELATLIDFDNPKVFEF
jgi:protein-L-isoaspartate(D-aspartate) O-methyltransferase